MSSKIITQIPVTYLPSTCRAIWIFPQATRSPFKMIQTWFWEVKAPPIPKYKYICWVCKKPNNYSKFECLPCEELGQTQFGEAHD